MKKKWKIGDECSFIYNDYNGEWPQWNGVRINGKIFQIIDHVVMVLPYCNAHEQMQLLSNLMPYKKPKRLK